MQDRNKKMENLVKELSARFLERENNRSSLITITEVTCSSDLKHATIYISVMPSSKENAALMFVKRQLGDLRDFLGKNIRAKNIPFLEVMIDQGEKNRQKIDELLRGK